MLTVDIVDVVGEGIPEGVGGLQQRLCLPRTGDWSRWGGEG